MDYDQYIKRVKERALYSSDEEAARSVRSVLEVLSARLSAEEADDIAALLPKELKPYLKRNGQVENFGLDEFLSRVAEKEGVDPTIARYHSVAVLSALAAAVPTSELIHAFSELPREIRDLFQVENWVKKVA